MRYRLTLGSATGGTGISAHGNGLLVIDDILEVDESTLQLPSVDRLGSLAGVLEADAEVRAPSAGALCVGDCVCGVTDLFISVSSTFELLYIYIFCNCDDLSGRVGRRIRLAKFHLCRCLSSNNCR